MITTRSRKGNCYDNACIESFHGIIKRELIFHESYKTRNQAKRNIFEYIVSFYNYKRIHSTNQYKSPIVYEKEYYKRSIDTAVKKILSSLRSEEHTSELQSRGHLVCRLLLEKKK